MEEKSAAEKAEELAARKAVKSEQIARRKAKRHKALAKGADEPRWNSNFIAPDAMVTDKDQYQLLKILNWYNSRYNQTHAYEMLREYAENSGHRKEFSILKESDVRPNVGWISRIISNNQNLPEFIVDRFKTDYNALIKAAREILNKTAAVKVVSKRSIQECTEQQSVFYLNVVDQEIDKFIEAGCKSDWNILDWTKTKLVKPVYLNKISEEFVGMLDELSKVLRGKDEQLKEAYSNFSRPQLRRFHDFVKAIVEQATEVAKNTKTVSREKKKSKKQSKRRQKSPEKLVAKVKFLDTHEEYGIKSISPQKIIGASEVWVFNTKYRRLTRYVAPEGAVLSISGTKILGFDEENSIGKKLRKPKEQLQTIIESAKVSTRKEFEKINSKPRNGNGRLTKDVVILKVY